MISLIIYQAVYPRQLRLKYASSSAWMFKYLKNLGESTVRLSILIHMVISLLSESLKWQRAYDRQCWRRLRRNSHRCLIWSKDTRRNLRWTKFCLRCGTSASWMRLSNSTFTISSKIDFNSSLALGWLYLTLLANISAFQSWDTEKESVFCLKH